MEIRLLKQQELLDALHLVWEVFVEEVAPLYTPEGVAEFQKFIKYDNINPTFENREITLFGAFEGTEMCGVMAVKRAGHICLFYVKKQWQGRGIGRQLFQAVENYCFYTLRVKRITVNAAPGAVPKYEKLGFSATGQEQNENGIRFLPMELYIDIKHLNGQRKKSKAPIIVAIVAGVVVLIMAVFAVVMLFTYRGSIVRNSITSHNWTDPFNDDNDSYDYDDDYGYDDSYSDDYSGEELSGIAQIDVYEEAGLTYTIEDKDYTFADSEKKNTTIDFSVKYPSIKGLDSAVSDKVNEALKNCAMETVDNVYTNPSDEIKERVITEEYPALVSYVEYKVTYISKDFISVVFQDNNCQGNIEEYFTELRTKNINLKDGTVYEVKDIIKMDNSFLSEIRNVLEDEADDPAFLNELSDEDMKKSLEGDSINGVYNVEFFAAADGMEIGYSLNYPAGDANNLGFAWVTAPFDWDEVQRYKNDNAIWDILQ